MGSTIIYQKLYYCFSRAAGAAMIAFRPAYAGGAIEVAGFTSMAIYAALFAVMTGELQWPLRQLF